MSYFAFVLALGIGAQWLAWRLRLPSILLLLLAGFLAGPVTHLINPRALLGEALLPVVSMCVGIILFEGGMSLRVSDLKQAGNVVWRLVTVAAAVSGVIAAVAARYVVGLSWPIASLLGALLVVTGPTVIGPMLRHVRPVGIIGPILRWEGIVIDPLGALCAVIVFEAFNPTGHGRGLTLVAWGAVRTIGVGVGLGVAAAALVAIPLRRYWLPDHLHNPFTLVLVVVALVLSNRVQPDSGLFTVTVMGIVLANQRWVPVHHIAEFKESLSVLLISTLFVLLSARLELSQITTLSWRDGAFLLVLIFIARPLAVTVATYGSSLTARERLFLAAMAPRGIVAAAVSSVFAVRLRQANVPGAEKLAPLVFAVIVGSVVFYGLTAAPLGRWLRVARPEAQGCLIVGAHALARAIGVALQDAGIHVLLVDTNRSSIALSRLQGLPTFLGSIVGPRTDERLDMSGIGRLMALTPNDEVNALACVRFAKLFGRSQVYQLSPARRSDDSPRVRSQTEMSDQLRGRPLFYSGCTLSELESRLAAGESVKKTVFTERFDLAAFRSLHPEALPLFLLGNNGELQVMTEDPLPAPRAGQTLISMIAAVRPAPQVEKSALSMQ